jgi:hypothetical protein
LLHELVPELCVISDQLKARWQAKVMSVRGKQFHAEAVNRAKEGATKCLDDLERKASFKNSLARALLHLIGRAVGIGDDD